ncbi:MAG: shikimate kinase AroK [Acidiferrobacterales bacterium]
MKIPENIFLIGPMGVGKSTIGRQLANLLGKDFMDTDHEIEKRTGVDIPTIFDIEGEEGFRKREAAIVDEMTSGSNLVLATGGGVILREDNRRALRRGFVVYLSASLGTLVERTRRDKSRPLLQNTDKQKKIEELMAERDPIYREESDLIVETDGRSAKAVAKEIVDQLKAV